MTADPSGMRRTAARLGGTVEVMRAAPMAALAGAGWSGAAAAQARARADDVRAGADRLASALDEVAAAIAAAANRAEAALERHTAIDCRADALTRQMAGPFLLEPRSVVLERQAELRRCLAGVAAERAEAEQELSRAGQDLARALDAVDPIGLLPPWARTAIQAAAAIGAVHSAVDAGRRAVSYGRWLGHVLAPAWRGTAREVAARAAFVKGRFLRLPWLERVAPGASRTFLPLTVAAAARDAVLGGGYPGWRGATTRVLGAGAALSGVVLLVGAGPVVGAVAGGVLTAHLLWSAGNAVYDHRRQIGSFLARAGGAIADRARAATSAVTGAAQGIGRALRDGFVGLATGGIPALGSG